MSVTTSVQAISGDHDQTALPVYASEYVIAAKRRMIHAQFVSIPGKGHEILLDPQVIQLVAEEMRR